MADRPIAISLFSGAGGLDLGVEAAGYRVAAALEPNRDAADTLEKNFHSLASPVIREDIISVPTDRLLEAAGLRSQRPALLVGGPPCTPFSKSAFWLEWKRQGLDPNASLLQAYTRVLREAQPDAFILENVYALTYNNKASRPAFTRLLAEIDEAGYASQWRVLNAADYGVAQLRPRLFVVGVRGRDTALPPWPEPTHGGRWERRQTGSHTRPHVTTGEALARIVAEPEPEENVGGQFGHLLPEIPPGENYLHFTARRGHPEPLFEWRSRFWSFLLKLDPERPSPTIQAQPGPYVGPFHWENRRLRVAEVKAVFGFPSDFELVGSRNSVQAQLGNSVAPPVSKALAQSLA